MRPVVVEVGVGALLCVDSARNLHHSHLHVLGCMIFLT